MGDGESVVGLVVGGAGDDAGVWVGFGGAAAPVVGAVGARPFTLAVGRAVAPAAAAVVLELACAGSPAGSIGGAAADAAASTLAASPPPRRPNQIPTAIPARRKTAPITMSGVALSRLRWGATTPPATGIVAPMGSGRSLPCALGWTTIATVPPFAGRLESCAVGAGRTADGEVGE